MIPVQLYHVFPRIGEKPDPSALGYRFTYCLLNTGGSLRVFIATELPRDSLSKFMDVREYSVQELTGETGLELYVSEARLKNRRDFWLRDTVILDPPSIASSLGRPGLMCIGFSRDTVLDEIFFSRARGLLKARGTRGGRVEAETILDRARRGLWTLRIMGAARDRITLGLIEEKYSTASYTGFKWVRHIARTPGELWGYLKPLETGFWTRVFPGDIPVVTSSRVYDMMVLPDPAIHNVEFARRSLLPEAVPVRSGADCFRIGSTLNGREVRLCMSDLERHVYVIGQTGSGKTSFLKLLVHRVHETGEASIIVIDPHGDMALELGSEISGSLLYDPVDNPFSINPLDLPKHRDRDYAVSVAIDILLDIFREVLKLVNTAVNVRYLLRVVLRALYSRSDSPTMADLYNTILGLYDGRVTLGDLSDYEWRRQIGVLRSMQRQSLISALSRLEPYARDRFLRELTSRTSVDFEEMMSPGSLTLFSIPKAVVGGDLARLIASTIVIKTWYEALARSRLGKPRTPVFLIIDEFQFVSDLPLIDIVFSEARKYGLHLVVAHQHTGQIPGQLIQSVLTNTGVKLVFQVAGEDAEKLSTIDADFARLLRRTLTSLSTGMAVLKIAGRPGEQPPPPLIVKLDYLGSTGLKPG